MELFEFVANRSDGRTVYSSDHMSDMSELDTSRMHNLVYSARLVPGLRMRDQNAGEMKLISSTCAGARSGRGNTDTGAG